MTEAPRLADHLALDFLNTVVQIGDERIDFLSTDEDVRTWLGVSNDTTGPTWRRHALRSCAQALRDIVRSAVGQRQAGKPVDVAALNAFLAHDRSVMQLSQPRMATLELRRQEGAGTPEQLLMPVARAAAELLAQADFDLVRHCEGADCLLTFYDRTKSHRRRWCSMATCGNRHKVASFRLRQAP